MTANHRHDNPILVTGAAGAVGGIGRSLTELLLARGHKVRALVRREDGRAEALRRLGAGSFFTARSPTYPTRRA
jgi:nucleoside-diphosphate-sugar epimerase